MSGRVEKTGDRIETMHALGGMPHEESEKNKMVVSFCFALVFPVFWLFTDSGKFPGEVVIPVETPDSNVVDFPWDQPIEKN